MTISQLLIEPFADDFMRYALASVLFLAVGAAPVGVFLVMRRMSLVGDALGHAVLPGAAAGYIAAGSLSLPAMSLGGFAAGLAMALLAGLVSRHTNLKEDANFAAFEHTRFDEPLQAGLDCLYPGSVDYSALRPGTEFWIMEGGTAVGEGVITRNDSPPAMQVT